MSARNTPRLATQRAAGLLAVRVDGRSVRYHAMTPAITLVRRHGIAHTIHAYSHDPASESYGLEAAEKLGVAPERVFKTLVVNLEPGGLAVGIVPVCAMLDLKLMARAANARKATMADKSLVERTTGYVLGGVSPLGQKKPLPTYIDESARTFATIHVSAGRRGLEIELGPDDLQRLSAGRFAALSR